MAVAMSITAFEMFGVDVQARRFSGFNRFRSYVLFHFCQSKFWCSNDDFHTFLVKFRIKTLTFRLKIVLKVVRVPSSCGASGWFDD